MLSSVDKYEVSKIESLNEKKLESEVGATLAAANFHGTDLRAGTPDVLSNSMADPISEQSLAGDQDQATYSSSQVERLESQLIDVTRHLKQLDKLRRSTAALRYRVKVRTKRMMMSRDELVQLTSQDLSAKSVLHGNNEVKSRSETDFKTCFKHLLEQFQVDVEAYERMEDILLRKESTLRTSERALYDDLILRHPLSSSSGRSSTTSSDPSIRALNRVPSPSNTDWTVDIKEREQILAQLRDIEDLYRNLQEEEQMRAKVGMSVDDDSQKLLRQFAYRKRNLQDHLREVEQRLTGIRESLKVYEHDNQEEKLTIRSCGPASSQSGIIQEISIRAEMLHDNLDRYQKRIDIVRSTVQDMEDVLFAVDQFSGGPIEHTNFVAVSDSFETDLGQPDVHESTMLGNEIARWSSKLHDSLRKLPASLNPAVKIHELEPAGTPGSTRGYDRLTESALKSVSRMTMGDYLTDWLLWKLQVSLWEHLLYIVHAGQTFWQIPLEIFSDRAKDMWWGDHALDYFPAHTLRGFTNDPSSYSSQTLTTASRPMTEVPRLSDEMSPVMSRPQSLFEAKSESWF